MYTKEVSELFKGVGEFKSRITVDLDTKNKKKLFYFINRGLLIVPNLVGVKFYETNKGYHIIYYSKVYMSNKMIMDYRRRLGDDEIRILYSIRERPKQILFDRKIYKDYKSYKNMKKQLKQKNKRLKQKKELKSKKFKK